MVKFKDFSRHLSVFPVLFIPILFSRTFQDSPVYSSTFQACVNPISPAIKQIEDKATGDPYVGNYAFHSPLLPLKTKFK